MGKGNGSTRSSTSGNPRGMVNDMGGITRNRAEDLLARYETSDSVGEKIYENLTAISNALGISTENRNDELREYLSSVRQTRSLNDSIKEDEEVVERLKDGITKEYGGTFEEAERALRNDNSGFNATLIFRNNLRNVYEREDRIKSSQRRIQEAKDKIKAFQQKYFK